MSRRKNKNRCRRDTTKHLPASTKRFSILSHNNIAIRDSLLNTNLHLESPEDALIVCDMLNNMCELASAVAYTELQLTKKTAEVQGYASQIAILKRQVEQLKKESHYG